MGYAVRRQITSRTQHLHSGFQIPLNDSTMISPPFNSDRTFELSLSDTLPDRPDELYHLEERYLGKFSAHIGKNLHMMQYTRPDFMYAANRRSSYADTPSATEFQGAKKLIRYIKIHTLRTIIYPSALIALHPI